MSTPTFAPGQSTHLPTHLHHSQAARAVQSPPKASTSDGQRASTTASSTGIIASPTASSPSSSSSSIDSRSPASSVLTNSSIFSNGGGLSQASAPASVATTASPGSFMTSGSSAGVCATMEDDNEALAEGGSAADDRGKRHGRRGSGSGSRELAGLSVQENGAEGDAVETTSTSSAGTSIPAKTRRASTLSSSSGSAQRSSVGDEGSWGASGTEAGKGGRDSQPARRKAARLGSFRREDLAASGDGMAVEDDGATADTEKDDDDEPETAQAPPAGATTHFSTSSTVNSANSQIPLSSVNSNAPSSATRRPDPTPPQPPSRSQRGHVDLVSYPSADLLRLLASLLEQIAHTNDALRQRQRTASASRAGSGSNSPSAAAAPADDSETFTSEETQAAFQRGRFDAAPLNSPASPRYQDAGAAAEEQDEEADVMAEMPVTPGVDLLREVGEGGGVEGFMPSLGGTHTPLPLARRRGSSFVSHGPSSAMSRRSSANTPSLGQVAAVASRSGSGTATPGDSTAASTSAAAVPPPEPPLSSLLTASSNALSSASATLCFHARNVPAISIEAYLLRILKYCPTTNEVFLSLLVYFDRMARVGLEAQRVGIAPRSGSQTGASREGAARTTTAAAQDDEGTSKLFAIDSFNIHRLVIAGVTVASKFFSDVFYTNSRYAKVGGLPLHELNQLELQFLLLNDFRLVIPVDELQRYADQLILFWVGRNPSTGQSTHPHPAASTSSAPASGSTPARAAPSATAVHPTPSAVTSQPPFSTPTAPGTFASSSSFTPRADTRPRSIRSQPSSSGTSVTSTITPGTPSTPRTAAEGDSSDEDWARRQASASDDDGEEDDDGPARSRRTSRGSHEAVPMEQD